ncbi:MAG: DNA-3-methyladenine glycosylase [Robiginitomaculum sp.]|nr:DNA-3-methyladenine glycosylase [Robiginitomaculum sp.]MDQ7077647.1 DNA-3-methyladenine glycosylase [Robiginitomaculum sp.]
MHHKEAHAHLSTDPVMDTLIARHGPCPLRQNPEVSPYHALVRTIVFQQISGAAASAIMKRFLALFDEDFPRPESLATMDWEVLRAAGLSRNKALAVIDVAAKSLDGTIPVQGTLAALSDEEVISRLITVRGIGKWTAEMFLMSTLGRPDILPLNDVGLLNGAKIAYGLQKRPDAEVFANMGENWRPWRSVACWYLWQAADTKLA